MVRYFRFSTDKISVYNPSVYKPSLAAFNKILYQIEIYIQYPNRDNAIKFDLETSRFFF